MKWSLLLSLTILLLTVSIHASKTLLRDKNVLKTSVFLSPPFVLGPGYVENKYYYNIDFPRGHIALKDFNAEVVDESGNSIPLHETYLHHWVIFKYYGQISTIDPYIAGGREHHQSKIIMARNAGICQGNMLGQYYGLGSETRQTSTYVPDPYGIEVGNPTEIPNGYEERWMLNVHAIDTRGTVDRMGCTECRCDLYNVTEDKYGRALSKNYTGGLYCCYDQTQCQVREGFESVKRKLYLRYSVKWADWDDSTMPVKIYIFDVTDSGERSNSTEENARVGCQIEYEVEPCGAAGMDNSHCLDSKKTNLVMPRGGDVIYGVAHQHWGGVGGTLYGQDGRVICSSIPNYGDGKEAGNEDGYIVGMSTCYPKPGSIKISDGEVLTFESNYSSTQRHTGVMGLFYILVAEPPRASMLFLRFPSHDGMEFSKYAWTMVIVAVAIALVIAGVSYLRRTKKRREGYQPMLQNHI